MNKTFLTLSLLLSQSVGFYSYAQSDDACVDMAKYTCSSLNANDGTSIGPASASKAEITEKVKTGIFPDIKNALSKKIAGMPIDEKTRTKMLEKIKNIKFKGSDCSEMAPGLNANMLPDGFYSGNDNSYTLCKASAGMSEFALATSITHELAHSMDPCGVADVANYPRKGTAAQLQEAFPVKGMMSCLRSSKSVSAKSDPASTADFSETGFCSGDQITEAFADWLTAETMSDYISQTYPKLSSSQWRQGVANAYRTQCGTGTEEYGFNTHPEFVSRMQNIIAANPKIRKAMACNNPAKALYCDASNPDAIAKALAAPTKAGAGSKSLPSDLKEAVH